MAECLKQKVCYIFTPIRIKIILLFSGTEATIQRVMRAVPLSDLTMSGLGGGLWSSLKFDESKFPPIEGINSARL